MDLFKKCKDYTIVRDYKAKGLYPYFHYLESGQDTQVIMEGKSTVMIGSNNYLGLTSNPEVIEAGIAALKKYGSGCSGSRFLNGTLDIHLAFEKDLAKFLHKEACITFPSGFQSNLGIISALVGRNDYVVCDKDNHASIYDACRLSYGKMLRFEHADMEDLAKQLATIPQDHGILIVTDGVFSMRGDIAKLPEICKLAKQYGARVMVDDAHGLGTIGATGAGTAEYYGLTDQVDVIMGTFSKSLASLGGFCATTNEVIEYMMHNSRPFIFAASMPPANVACAHAALKILMREPERVQKLQEVSRYFRNGLKERGIPYIEANTPIIPIYVYEDEKAFMACKLLLERGVYVNPVVSPATPAGYALLRTAYTATHTTKQLDIALDAIKEVFEMLDIKK